MKWSGLLLGQAQGFQTGSYTVQPDREPGCLACGGTGTVLRAITASHYQAEPCPACDPAERAG